MMTTITRNNYEAYLLDYLEGSISHEDKEQLWLFFERHPELKTDLDVDLSLQLKAEEPVPNIGFNKNILKKHPADVYDLSAKEYLYIKQQEEGLNKEEAAELLLLEPDQKTRKKNESIYAQLKLKANTQLVYPFKNARKRWLLLPVLRNNQLKQVAAVLITLLLGSVLWINWPEKDGVVAKQTHDTTESVTVPQIAEAKIVEKVKPAQTPPSKDSLLKLSRNPMQLKEKKPEDNEVLVIREKDAVKLVTIKKMNVLKSQPINAYELGLNVMMPQYMDNNLLKRELLASYRVLHEEEKKQQGISVALVEGGVKLVNFFSRDEMQLQKYYNTDGELIGYDLKGENLEVNRRKANTVSN